MNIDVVLVTYGEPPRPHFMKQWEYSNRILRKLTRMVAPIPKFVIPALGAYRGYTRVKSWKEEKFTSPLEGITFKQAKGMGNELQAMQPDIHWRTHIAYEFRRPLLEDILYKIVKTGTDGVAIIPMYAPESDFTTQISMRDCQAFIDANPGALPQPEFITFRDELTSLAELMVKFVRSQVRKIGLSPKDCKELPLICGCHGTVIRPPEGIHDTGYQDTFDLYQRLEESLKSEFADVRIGWLNHRLGGDWTTPTAEQSAKNLLEQGYKTWIYFPFGFLADNAESLLEGRVVFRDLGVESYHHLPCINEDPDFLRFIAQIIINRLN